MRAPWCRPRRSPTRSSSQPLALDVRTTAVHALRAPLIDVLPRSCHGLCVSSSTQFVESIIPHLRRRSSHSAPVLGEAPSGPQSRSLRAFDLAADDLREKVQSLLLLRCEGHERLDFGARHPPTADAFEPTLDAWKVCEDV